jgi:hypothetical protein
VGGSRCQCEYMSDADFVNFLLFGLRISPANVLLVCCCGRILNVLKSILTVCKILTCALHSQT